MSSDKKYTSIHYATYLQLDKILGAQNTRSKELGAEAHEETLFIIIHQVYELWFKQMIHEIDSVMTMFRTHNVDEKNIDEAVLRLERVNEILKLLIQQIKVLETMTPIDFLEFRAYLFPAS
ncbi:MAG: tryptophan 2,3-dioxygenase family protein, partial [Saprospiraceae bacterium]